MNDIGTQIWIGVVITVISGLILGTFYLLSKPLKNKLKEKWKDKMFQISTLLAIGGCLFTVGTLTSFFSLPLEQATLLSMVGVGLFIISSTFIYAVGLNFIRLQKRIKELEEKLKEKESK